MGEWSVSWELHAGIFINGWRPPVGRGTVLCLFLPVVDPVNTAQNYLKQYLRNYSSSSTASDSFVQYLQDLSGSFYVEKKCSLGTSRSMKHLHW